MPGTISATNPSAIPAGECHGGEQRRERLEARHEHLARRRALAAGDLVEGVDADRRDDRRDDEELDDRRDHRLGDRGRAVVGAREHLHPDPFDDQLGRDHHGRRQQDEERRVTPEHRERVAEQLSNLALPPERQLRHAAAPASSR
jgi:hypothetical protein